MIKLILIVVLVLAIDVHGQNYIYMSNTDFLLASNNSLSCGINYQNGAPKIMQINTQVPIEETVYYSKWNDRKISVHLVCGTFECTGNALDRCDGIKCKCKRGLTCNKGFCMKKANSCFSDKNCKKAPNGRYCYRKYHFCTKKANICSHASEHPSFSPDGSSRIPLLNKERASLKGPHTYIYAQPYVYKNTKLGQRVCGVRVDDDKQVPISSAKNVLFCNRNGKQCIYGRCGYYKCRTSRPLYYTCSCSCDTGTEKACAPGSYCSSSGYCVSNKNAACSPDIPCKNSGERCNYHYNACVKPRSWCNNWYSYFGPFYRQQENDTMIDQDP